MRADRRIHSLLTAIFAGLLSLGAVFCPITAFDLPANPVWIALCCILIAGLCVLCLHRKLALIPPIAALLLGAGAALWADLGVSLEVLCNHISQFYHSAYDTQVVRWSDADLSAADPTAALCAIGIAICLATAYCVYFRKTILPALALAIAPLAACMVVTDTVPDSWCLAIFLTVLVWLLLTQLTRRADLRQGNRLSLLAFVPVALAVLALFLAIPRESYRGQNLAEELLQNTQTTLNPNLTQVQVTTQEDLRQTGRFNNPRRSVMQVSAPQAGRLYLRQQVFGTYAGTAWRSGDSFTPDTALMPDYEAEDYFWENVGLVSISTTAVQALRFIPLYTNAATDATGITPNDGQTAYAYTQYLPTGTDRLYLQRYEAPARKPDYLSQEVWDWACRLSAQLTQGCTYTSQAAQAIADYVSASAAYSTVTQVMGQEETDFVRWFLEESDSGYCTHFASATTVLLQAAGIPALYVTGFAPYVQPGSTTVYLTDAHAWAEYYVPGLGWLVLESTPSAQEPEQTDPSAPALPTDPSQPGEATPTQPTEDIPAPTRPTGDAPTPTQKPALPLWPLWLLLISAAILAQWQLRLQLRKARQRSGHPNRRALAFWQEALLFARALGEEPDEQLLELAQKAKFSQHKLSRAELTLFSRRLQDYRLQAQSLPWYRRLVLRLFRALY